ncbi:MAG TPA: hypothetical protein VGI78_27910 [Acetobacteraceae bacterium]|jgi:hypothetical protein
MPAVLTIPFDAFVGLVPVGSSAELAGNGYARQAAHFEYAADGVTICNVAAIQWQAAKPLTWGAIDLVELWDAPTGGSSISTLLPTSATVLVSQYAIARIPPAGIQVVQKRAPRPFGTSTFGVGRFGTGTAVYPIGSGIGSPYGVGGYGVGPYETLSIGVPLEITFDTSQHVCEPGEWLPGPFQRAA